MQSAAQRDATRNGAGGSGQGERSQPFRADLVHWKWQANYWRSQHARAKERIAEWQAKWKATQQELADALQKLRGLRQQVQELQQENEGLRQENKQLLQSPFKKRSEKSKSQGQGGSDGGQPYSRNGEEVSERVEVWIEGHIRRIRRPRYRASCECCVRTSPGLEESDELETIHREPAGSTPVR